MARKGREGIIELLFSLKDGSEFSASDYQTIKSNRDLLCGNISTIIWKHTLSNGRNLQYRCPKENATKYCLINQLVSFSSGEAKGYVGIGYTEDDINFEIIFVGTDQHSFVDKRTISDLHELQVF